jgi:hypothetical protein
MRVVDSKVGGAADTCLSACRPLRAALSWYNLPFVSNVAETISVHNGPFAGFVIGAVVKQFGLRFSLQGASRIPADGEIPFS